MLIKGVLKHSVSTLMEAADKQLGGRVPPVRTTTQGYFRDIHDHLSHITNTIAIGIKHHSIQLFFLSNNSKHCQKAN